MSHYSRQDVRRRPRARAVEPTHQPFSAVASRFAHWITGGEMTPDDGHEDELEYPDDYYADEYEDEAAEVPGPAVHAARAPIAAGPDTEWHAGAPEDISHATGPGARASDSRFKLAASGYDRDAVDARIDALERELAQLRSQPPAAPSISEELERLGEQTASILVVAHDQAQETTRQALVTAQRCMAEATADAQTITARAHERLHELDGETDSIWHERERLLEDVRVVSAALAKLADDASTRFPAAPPGATQAFDALAHDDSDDEPTALAKDDEPTDDTTAGEDAQSGDTGSWLAELRPE